MTLLCSLGLRGNQWFLDSKTYNRGCRATPYGCTSCALNNKLCTGAHSRRLECFTSSIGSPSCIHHSTVCFAIASIISQHRNCVGEGEIRQGLSGMRLGGGADSISEASIVGIEVVWIRKQFCLDGALHTKKHPESDIMR